MCKSFIDANRSVPAVSNVSRFNSCVKQYISHNIHYTCDKNLCNGIQDCTEGLDEGVGLVNLDCGKFFVFFIKLLPE